ncbi:FAD:protein FMN transferase [Collimonas silvisoli]|uniref:FAD:protein FMN transferase n=1 Tax=Collimonas silvisoli TaxID=2825884 RepID=UPI001B8AD53F|nr:FAD:protein FMN transferase [Collimonas silvisoli]
MPLPSNSLRRARPLLGTLVEIKIAGDPAILSEACNAAYAAIERVQQLMSFHDAGSDVSRINAADPACEICVDPHTFKVLEFAHQLGDLSAGAFDISTAAVLVDNGFLPAHRLQQSAAIDVTYRDLELLNGHRVRWQRRGCIDLGGIAKGYAVDCAIAALQSHGIASGTVNAGGDLRCFGEPQAIHVRQPDQPASLIPLGYLSNHAIATSAGYFAGIGSDKHRIDPLVDPQQRICTTWGDSVSVVAPDCMTADALTKVVRLAPIDAPAILERFNAQAIVTDGQAVRSCGARLLQTEITP